jgi:ribonucleoside-diphosphate reductase alpha chain
MAEAIELNLPLGEGGIESVENIIKPLLELEKEQNNKEESSLYDTNSYYVDDTLGSDVLNQKYLAPGEKHPHELWKRQAKALASVEKNKSIRDQWEENFYS